MKFNTPYEGKREHMLQTISIQQQVSQNTLGVEGKFKWPIRLVSILGFGAAIVINYFIGRDTGSISDKYHLYVTPPGYFFTIWAVIYSTLALVNIVNLFRNTWSLKTHIAFGISNLFNILWIVSFGTGNNAGVFASSFIITLLAVSILLTWIALGDIPEKDYGIWNYVQRNTFAFYLGWVIAATNINWGMDIVYWWGGSKEAQLIIFWVFAPLCAIGAFTFNCLKYGKVGALSCFCLWISAAWAFAGAAITSHNCLNGLQTLC